MSARVPAGTVMPTFSAMNVGRLADERRVRQPLRRDQLLGERVGFRRRQEVAALIQELPPRFGFDRLDRRRPSWATSTARRCRTTCR